MMERRPSRSQIVALVATLLFHIGVVIALVCLYLRYSPSEQTERTWPPVDSSEVLFGGEYVMIGDNPVEADNSDAEAPAESAEPQSPQPLVESTVNNGTPAPTPSPVVTSGQPSPAKVVKETPPAQTGPSKAEIEAAERAKREEETRQSIANRVQFGSTGSGQSGQGKTGSPDGNSNVGVAKGTPGYNLKGRTIASWSTPAKGPLGTITIRVSVNRDGAVTSASYASGTGAAAASEATRNSCIAAARASRFSVDHDAPASQPGTITYRFQ